MYTENKREGASIQILSAGTDSTALVKHGVNVSFHAPY